MATVTRENIGLLTDKLTVNVTKEDYYPEFEKSLKKISKTISLPGFRAGKVPMGVVKKMHGQAIFSEEVVNSIEKNLVEYLKKENIDVFGQAIPSEDSNLNGLNMNEPKDYSFSFEIGLRPEFSLPDLKSIKLPSYKIEIGDDMVAEEVERYRLRHGKMDSIEAVGDDYDVLHVQFIPADAAQTEESDEAKNARTLSLLLKYFSDAAKKQLNGKKVDDEVEMAFGEVFTGKEKEWIARDLGLGHDEDSKKFKIKIEKLEHVTPAEFNEDFFKAAYPGKTISNEEEFKAAVRAEVEEYWNTQARNHLEHEIYHVLMDETKVDFPEEFLKKWMKMNPNQAKSNPDDPKEFKNFLNGLKWSLIGDKVMAENNFSHTTEELRKEALNQLMGYMGMTQATEEEAWVKDYLDRFMQDEKMVQPLEERLTVKKIFDWATAQIQAVETKVSVEEFSNLIQEHNHQHHH